MQMMMQVMYVLQIKACHIDEVDGKCVGGVDNVGETDVGDDDGDDGDDDDGDNDDMMMMMVQMQMQIQRRWCRRRYRRCG